MRVKHSCAWEVCKTGKNCLRFEANLGYRVRLHLTKKKNNVDPAYEETYLSFWVFYLMWWFPIPPCPRGVFLSCSRLNSYPWTLKHVGQTCIAHSEKGTVCFHIYLCSIYNQNWAAGTVFFLATCHAWEHSVWDPGRERLQMQSIVEGGLSPAVSCIVRVTGDLRGTCASSYSTNRKLVQNTEAPPPLSEALTPQLRTAWR